jgi:hypothetical protein
VDGIAEYARKMGASRQTLEDWVKAARVAKCDDQPSHLIPYTTSLSILHRALEEDWSDLVSRMLTGRSGGRFPRLRGDGRDTGQRGAKWGGFL